MAQQIDVAREYCQHHNRVLDKLYVDESKLSSNTEKRDALQELLSDLLRRFRHINDRYKREKASRENPFGVIFWKSNRLGRDSIEATNIKTDLRLRGITIVDLVTSANTGNAAVDALIEAFQQWKDEQDLEEISQNAKRGLAQLVGTRDNDSEFLRHNPDWECTGGYLGIRPGGVPTGFSGERVQVGVYGRKKGRKSGEPRIAQRLVPDPALIPHEWFEAEQKRQAENAKKHNGRQVDRNYEPRRVGSKYLLSGLVVCGHVDSEEHPMNVESIPGKKGKRGSYTFFICSTMKNSRGQACEAKRVSTKALDQTVIENLLAHVLTTENLRPLAKNIAQSLEERSNDAGTRIAALEDKLAEVKKSLENIMDAIENMGYAKHFQQRYDERRREEEELISELAVLEALQVDPGQIAHISDEALEGWICYMRDALEGDDKALVRRIIQQFVAKIVIKEGTGTLYYTFPFPDDSYMPSFRDLDLRVLFSSPSQKLGFALAQSDIAIATRRNPDKELLYATVLELREQGMSYREIGQAVGLHWTRIQQVAKKIVETPSI